MIKIYLILGIGLLFTGCATINRSWVGEASPISISLSDLNETQKESRVAIIVSVETSFSANYFAINGLDINSWKKSAQQEMIGYRENSISKMNLSNIRVIDRFQINSILSEQRMSLTGAIEPNEVTKVGKLAGATHILFVDVQRTPGQFGRINDHVTQRLIDVETGSVIATQWMSESKQ